MKNYEFFLDILPEVKDALENNKPVVALESTIISHGMPYPENIKMAQKTEAIIRDAGAIPATIAIINGKIKIGLNEHDLTTLATAKHVDKVSRRDFATIIASGELGATTVASTMFAASLANIRFFVTGGIGGVHRGYENTLDVSADLEELSETNVTVVCAGAKAILDLPRTMEYLETKGVPVIGFKTKVLPAFYTRESSIQLQHHVESPEQLAKIISIKDKLGMRGGVLVVNPIPESDSLDKDLIDQIIEAAIDQSVKENVSGKDVTPYLLANIVEKTKGKSLEANLSLVYNNARVGAQIAKAYYDIVKS